MDRKIRARLANFVKNLEGPLGKVPLDRAIRNDLALFQELRDSGASWVQITNALAAAGARRADGSAMTADHLRSAVSRQLKRQVDEGVAPSPVHQPLAATNKRLLPPASKKSPASPGKSATTKSDRHTRQKLPVASTATTDKTSSILQKLARTRQLRET